MDVFTVFSFYVKGDFCRLEGVNFNDLALCCGTSLACPE